MSWPNEIYPSATKYASIEFIRRNKIVTVAAILIAIYIIINMAFGLLYYLVQPFSCPKPFFDCQYFSFVTGLTIGYGDISPINTFGKLVVMIHGVIATLYFALMIAILGIKVLSPYRTVHFSNKVLFDGRCFLFRIINSHRSLLVNPEIRIAVVLHCTGNTIAPTVSVAKIDTLHWLDNHDFVLGFPAVTANLPDIRREWENALSHQGDSKSRFKIRVSITGSYGFQQYYEIKSYDCSDISHGSSFSPIAYNDEDKKTIRNIRFNKFGDFWTDFNKIV